MVVEWTFRENRDESFYTANAMYSQSRLLLFEMCFKAEMSCELYEYDTGYRILYYLILEKFKCGVH